MARRQPLHGQDARTIEHLLGLRRWSLTAVERRRNGDFALLFRTQKVGDRYPRVLRLPARRVFGYQQRSPHARERDIRARHKANARRFALWTFDHVGYDCPLVQRAWDGDLAVVDELRDAILRCCPPDYAIVVWGWAS